MEFHSYKTMFDALREQGVPRDRINDTVCRIAKVYSQDNDVLQAQLDAMRCQMLLELSFIEEHRPYYNVWPTVVPLLSKIELDFPGNMVLFPDAVKTIAFRFPKHNNPLHPIRAACVAPAAVVGNNGPGLAIWVDLNETAESDWIIINGRRFRVPVMSFVVFPLWEKTVNESLSYVEACNAYHTPEMSPEDLVDFRQGQLRQALKVIITTLLIASGKDEKLINPDVLAKDETAYHEALRRGDLDRIKTITDRAFRRRGPGWDIGKEYERKPHGPYIVPPHPQRYHVGKGRTQVIVRTRRGYTVEKEELFKIPTGYEEQ